MSGKRLAVATLAVLLTAAPLFAQRGGGERGSTRVPSRSGRVFGTGIPPARYVPERSFGGPIRPGPVPLIPENRTWVRIETANFTLYSSASEQVSRDVAHDLDMLTAELLQTSRLFELPPGRTRVFLFGDRKDVQPYFNALRGVRVDASGLTFRHPLGSTLLVDTTARGGTVLTPRHELIHDLLQRPGSFLPLWAEEGLAEYYSNGGNPIREHISRLRLRLPLSLQSMFSVTPMSSTSGALDFYAQSWSAVRVLMARDRAAFFALLEDIAAGASPGETLHFRFGFSAKELEAMMRKGWSAVPETPRPAADTAIVAVKVSRAEILFQLGELLARVDGRQADAEQHFQAALTAEPGNASLLLRYSERLIRQPSRSHEALDCALLARSLGADEGRAHAVIGAARAAANDESGALISLQLAHRLRPDDFDTAWRLYEIYMRQDERELADSLLPLLLETHRAADARRILLRVDLARADAMARRGRYPDAVQILRDLAPRMPPRTRASIEHEMAKLEAMSQF